MLLEGEKNLQSMTALQLVYQITILVLTAL